MTTLATSISAILLLGALCGQLGISKRGCLITLDEDQIDIVQSEEQMEAVLPFAGYLKEATLYRANVVCDMKQELLTTIPLHGQLHQAVRIEWDNLSKFPELKKGKCQREIVLRVVSKQTSKVPHQNQWRVTYHCQIVSVVNQQR